MGRPGVVVGGHWEALALTDVEPSSVHLLEEHRPDGDVGSAVLDFGDHLVIARHGAGGALEGGPLYVLPHEIDHATNMRSLAEAGCDRVLAIGSVGSLRPELVPGAFVCPDDFIALDAPPSTFLRGHDAHRVPGFDGEWRSRVAAAFGAARDDLVDGGVYWQATGPRLETPAEIRLIAAHADVVGMTVASECVAAGELGLAYAAVCVVDNFANGVAATELTLSEVEAGRERNLAALAEALPAALSELR